VCWRGLTSTHGISCDEQENKSEETAVVRCSTCFDPEAKPACEETQTEDGSGEETQGSTTVAIDSDECGERHAVHEIRWIKKGRERAVTECRLSTIPNLAIGHVYCSCAPSRGHSDLVAGG
jgi:hypothetical protein